MSCYYFVHLVKHWHYTFVYTSVLSNKDNTILPLTLTPLTLNSILEILWIVKHRIVLTRTITNSLYYSRWTNFVWFTIVISYITTCILGVVDCFPSTTNNPSFWSWICWCNYCYASTLVYVWPCHHFHLKIWSMLQ